MVIDLKPIQAGGMNYLWKSPDGSFQHMFLKLDPSCDQDFLPGVVIVSDEHNQNAKAFSVKNLQREFPDLLSRFSGPVNAHWWIEKDEKDAFALLSKISTNPVFVG